MRKTLTALRDGLVETISEDWATKLLALVIAIGIWLGVQSMLVVDVRTRAEIRYTWPEDLIRLEEVPTSVSLTVQGPQSVVRRLERQRPVIVVDLSESPEGPTTVDFTALSISGLPPNVTVLHISPPSVELKLERTMTRKITVHPNITGTSPEGYRVVSVKANPSSVQVSGPRSLLKPPLSELLTDPIDLSELRTSRTVQVPLALPGRTVTTEPKGPVQVAVEIEAIQGVRSLEAPVTVSARGWTSKTETATLTFAGPLPVLNALSPGKVKLLLNLPDPPPAGPVVFEKIGSEPNQISVSGVDMAGITLARIDPGSITAEPPP